MNSWTPEQWGIFFGGLGLFMTTAVIPLLQILMNRKMNRNDEKATAARAILAAKVAEVHDDAKTIKSQTNGLTAALITSTSAIAEEKGHAKGLAEGESKQKQAAATETKLIDALKQSSTPVQSETAT